MLAVDQTQFNSNSNRKVDALIIRSLGHPIRLKILTMLDRQECNVKNIWECLGMEQCVVSQHLSVLKHHGIIDGRRNGVEMIYTIVNPLGVCRTYQLCKKWLPKFRSKTVENTLNSLVPSPHICCYNMLILFA